MSTPIRFFSAFYSDHFSSELEALKKVPKTTGDWATTQLAGGAKLFESGQIALILVTIGSGCELWLSGRELGRATREEAAADIEEFEAVQGEGGWKIFEIPN